MNLDFPKNLQKVYGIKSLLNTSNSQNQSESQLLTTDTLSNLSNHSNQKKSNLYYFTNSNIIYNYLPLRNKTPTTRKIKKKVKFNEKVDVIVVKSFKKYNKCEDENSLDSLLDENRSKHKRRKYLKNCECNLI